LYIVIAVFNGIKYTLNFLALLSQQIDGGFHVVLVDDGSTDDTEKRVRELYSEVVIVHGNGNWWWTRSTNEGIKKALSLGADSILIMNNDTLIEPGYIQTIKKTAEEHPGTIIGSLDVTNQEPRMVFFSGVKEIKWWKAKGIRYHRNYVPYDNTFTGLHRSICLNGRGTLIPAQVFKKTGFLDEKNLPQYASDFDFSVRAAKAGIPCYISWDCVVFSEVAKTGTGKPFIYQSWGTFLRSFFLTHSQTGLGTIFRYYRKHTPWPLLPIAITMQTARYLYSFYKRRKTFTSR
jgi:GT2 family glycosyltransferase